MEIGDVVTWNHDSITDGGQILHHKGDVSIIQEIAKTGGHWGKLSGYYMEERILGFKLEGEYGLFFPSCFEETKNL